MASIIKVLKGLINMHFKRIIQVLWSIWLAKNGQTFDSDKRCLLIQDLVLSETLDHLTTVGAATALGVDTHTYGEPEKC